ncbi:hypothetical protein DF186_15160, partial [Enterococcus hirae]
RHRPRRGQRAQADRIPGPQRLAAGPEVPDQPQQRLQRMAQQILAAPAAEGIAVARAQGDFHGGQGVEKRRVVAHRHAFALDARPGPGVEGDQ